MQEDLVTKLSEFGFTVNQAKVYLSIIESGLITAGEISKISQLHPQDVYKILPKLEKMGLVTKTIDKPALVQAIPVEKALNRLVAIENEKTKKRITQLKSYVKELENVAVNHPFMEKPQEENLFVTLTNDEQVRNMSQIDFSRISKECNMMLSLELIASIMQNLRNHMQIIGTRAKIRVIVQNANPKYERAIVDAIEKIRPKKGDFTAKIVSKSESINYYLIDDSALWVSMKKKTASGLPCVLWTDDEKMIQFFHDNFNDAWNEVAARVVELAME